MRKWIAASTFLALFSERLIINVGSIHLLYFYFIMAFNLLALAYAGWLWMPKGMWVFLAYLVLSGGLGLLSGTDTLVGFLKSFTGILPTAIYFFAFLRFMKFDAERCLAWYAHLTVYACLYGFVYLPFQSYAKGQLESVFTEPAHFALVCVPAVFYYADQWQQSRKYGGRFLIVLLAIILSQSSSGFIGLFFCLYLCGTRYRLGKFVAPALVLLAVIVVYSSSQLFRTRFDDTTQSLDKQDVKDVNESTFGLVSNEIITYHTFLDHPLLGGGLGSHEVAYDKYIDQVEGHEIFAAIGLDSLGRWDASSLFLRIVSEMGLVGVGLSIWFLCYCWPRNATASERRIALTVLTYIFLKCLRFGSYFDPEVFFFFGVYAVNGLHARMRNMGTLRAPDRLDLGPMRAISSGSVTA